MSDEVWGLLLGLAHLGPWVLVCGIVAVIVIKRIEAGRKRRAARKWEDDRDRLRHM